MQTITWDIESNNLLNSETIDYNASPYVLKPSFAMHCIVVEVHGSGDIVAFYDGDKYILDGRRYEESDDLYEYVLEDYKALEYEHKQLSEFPDFIKNNGIKKAIAHNGINFDWLATKLYYGMDYTIEEDTYKGLPVGNDSWHGKPMELVDTMVMSKTLHPDRFGGHTLDKLSESVGFRKIDFRPHIKNKSHKFKTFAADMLYYCIIDTQATTKVHAKLVKEWGDWDWNDAMKLEKKVAEIVTRQEHRGFSFDSKLAEQNIEDLDRLMQECIDRVGDALPPKPAGKGFMKDYTPPKEQFLKSGKPNAFIKRFADKHDGVIDETGEGVYEITILGETHKLPLPQEPLITEVPATLKDSSHIKEWLVGAFRWIPSEFNERDLSVKQAKGKPKRTQEEFEKAVNAYVDQTLNSPLCKLRCELLEVSPSQLKKKLLGTQSGRPCKVPTNPKYTRGQDKEICPNLEELQKQFPHARDAVNYLTYQHRRNSILGGGAEWDEDVEPEKGFMSQVREDGRIGTPADTQGAGTTRFTHRGVANIPRITSLFGSQMRGLFGSGEGCYQIGYDFDSLICSECKTY